MSPERIAQMQFEIEKQKAAGNWFLAQVMSRILRGML